MLNTNVPWPLWAPVFTWFSRRCLVSSPPAPRVSTPDSLLPSLNDWDLLDFNIALVFLKYVYVRNISMHSSLTVKLAFPSFILMNKEWSFVWEKYKSDSTTQMGLIHWWLKYQINSLPFILAFYHFPDLTDITTFDILICLLWLKLRWALQFLFNKMISVNSLLWRTRRL